MNQDPSSAPATRRRELWQFVPLADYTPPGLPASSAAANALASLKRLFQSRTDETEAPAKKEDELRSLSQMQLEHLARPIDWGTVSRALDTTLAARQPAADGAPAVTFVIGQPHCGHAEIVASWAARNDACLIDPPSHEEILAADGRWQAAWPDNGRTFALPRLERCFLRHAGGLALVRRLLEQVARGRAGSGLIGCDSWAWPYLQRIWPVPRPDALTLQAFDGPRLLHLFAALAPEQRHLRFRNARTGRETLSLPLENDAVSDEIVQLAAHCRGNVGTACSYWRQRLRATPDEDEASAAPPVPGPDTADSRAETVWLSAGLQEPGLPTAADEDVALVLHALLLHNGLPDAALPDVLPLPHHRCVAIVLRLNQLDLLAQQDGRWTVTALGYSLVRAWLRGRDYLTDDF